MVTVRYNPHIDGVSMIDSPMPGEPIVRMFKCLSLKRRILKGMIIREQDRFIKFQVTKIKKTNGQFTNN